MVIQPQNLILSRIGLQYCKLDLQYSVVGCRQFKDCLKADSCTIKSHRGFLAVLFANVFVCRWKLNGTAITARSDSHYSLSGGNLRISHLNKDQDAGTYQCLASNSFGTIVSREASLTFACKLQTIFCCLSDQTVPVTSVRACDIKDMSVGLVIVYRVLPDKMINMESSPWGVAAPSALTQESSFCQGADICP